MKKLLVFLMVVIPLVVIVILNATISVVTDIVSIPVEKVVLNEETYVSNIDNEYQLKANVFPTNATDKTVFYESSNEEILKVDNEGKVTFVNFGSAYVKVTTLDGNKSSSCYFVVTDTKVHGVMLYTIDEVNEVEVNNNLKVYCEIFPKEANNQNVIYSSSNEEVATIDENGVVTGKSVGETEIKVTTVDGEFSSSKIINVYKKVQSFELLENHKILENPIYTLPVVISPSDAKITRIKFSSSDESIATVSNVGVVSFYKAGKVTIKLVCNDVTKEMTLEYTNGFIQEIKVKNSIINCRYEDTFVKLDYEIFPKNLYNTELRFYSSNDKIASVNNNGLVELKYWGKVTISIEADRYDGSLYSKNILMFIHKDCTEIISDNIVSASPNVKIKFTTLPKDNTSNDFIFTSSNSIAKVDEKGNVIFTEKGKTYIKIESKLVSKQIEVTYTGGFATDFNVEKDITLLKGESFFIRPSFIPKDTIYQDVILSIKSQNPKHLGANVVKFENNNIVALNSGNAVVLVKVKCNDNEFLTKEINVIVKENLENIEIITNLESYQNEFITSNQIVDFNISLIPSSATEVDLSISVDDKEACSIYGNKLFFNYPSTITLTVKNNVNGVSSMIKIRYTTNILDVTFEEMKNYLDVGEEVLVNVKSCLPKAYNKDLILKITSQNNGLSNNVVKISGNSIKAVNGGNAKISVYLSGIYVKTFDINVNRKATSLDVFPKNIKTTSNNVTLFATVLPEDTTNKNVVYTLEKTDIAILNKDNLIFNKNGIVKITAKTTDGSNLECSFTIEKTSLGEDISTNVLEHIIYVGKYVQLKSIESAEIEYSVISGNENIEINETGLLYAKHSGESIVNVILKDINGFVIENNTIKIHIYETVSEIELLGYEYYKDEYITAKNENEIKFNVYPSNARQEIIYSLNETTIAKIENNILKFYGTGKVELRAKSLDGECITVFEIRYTGGGAYDFDTNLDKEVVLNKGESIQAQILNWYPKNTLNKNFSIKIVGDNNQKIILVKDNLITALSGGNIDIVLRASLNLTKIVKIKVIEDIESIKFVSMPKLTYETNINLNYEILPHSATNKKVKFIVSDENIAYVENGMLKFLKPSKVKIKVVSLFNKNIFDEIEIESTMGYVKDFEIENNNITLETGMIFEPKIISFTPNVLNQKYKLEIISQNPIVEGNNVIEIIDNKILAKNGGTVKVKIYADTIFDFKPFKIIDIKVIKKLQSIDIKFDSDLSVKNDTYITALNMISFNILPYPKDIKITDFSVEYNEEYLTIKNNVIQFLKPGLTNIIVHTGGVKKEVSIMWTQDECIEAKINDQAFTIIDGKKTLKVNVNDTYMFKLTNIVPKDISFKNVKLNVKEIKQNYYTLPVYSIENSVILFKNGGEVTFEVVINNLSLGEYTFIVLRKSEYIKTEKVQYTGVNHYLIMASLLPEDTTNKILYYECLDKEIAKVNENGEIIFFCEGRANVNITSYDGIEQNIVVIYTRKVEQIFIKETKKFLSVGGTVLLEVESIPSDIENVKIKYVSSNENLATVTSKGRVIAKNETGYVTITAYLEENNTIFTSVTFCISKYVTDIALKDDIVNDNLGIKGERVFGTKYFNKDLSIKNTYQMEVLSIIPSDTKSELVWSSSDEKIATVSSSGLVTFIKEGIVTIRVEPKEQYNVLKPIYDSYTFKLVDGFNIYNYDEYFKCVKDKTSAILQNDIILTDDIINKYSLNDISIVSNIYGNGYMMTANNLNKTYNKFVVKSNNVILDNVVFRGEDLTNKTLEDLTTKSTLMILWFVKDIQIKNCILENGFHCLRVYCSTLYLSGTIIRNGGISNLLLSHQSNSQIPTVVTANNCIFKDGLFGSIIYDYDNSENDTYASKLIIIGKLYIYNFRRPEEMVVPIVSNYIPNIDSSIKSIFSFFNNVKHTYKGKDYYNLGIIVLNADYVIDKYYTKYKLDMTKTENLEEYNFTEISGNVFLYEVYPIVFNIGLLTVMPNNTTITPESDFDSTIYKDIREK